MSTFTENYNLIKPDEGDYYDVTDFNENMDTIDGQMMLAEQAIDGVSEKIGNATDANDATVFGRLTKIQSQLTDGTKIIKSIQYVVHMIQTGTTSESFSINPVEPTKCVVLFERLQDTTSNAAGYVQYTLNADSISLVHTEFTSVVKILLGFWIIEFY